MILLLDGRPVRGRYPCDPPGLLVVLVVGMRWPLTILTFAGRKVARANEKLAA